MSRLEPDQYIDYDRISSRVEIVKRKLGRPLTLSEKILYGHLDDPNNQVSIGSVSLRLYFVLVFLIPVT